MNKLLCCLVLALPLHRMSLTSGFGYRTHPVTGRYAFHAGVDLRAHAYTVFAVAQGSVKAGYNAFLGNYIRIISGKLVITYGHLSQLFVVTGDAICSGDPLAISGATGRVTGEHLHFAIAVNGHYINPIPFLYYAMQHINKQ